MLFKYGVSLYRLIFVGLIAYEVTRQRELLETYTLLLLVGLFLYVLVFGLFNTGKLAAYVEWIAVLVISFLAMTPWALALLTVPFLRIVSTKSNQFDLLFFAGVAYAYCLATEINSIQSAIISGTVYLALLSVQMKFKENDYYQKKYMDTRKEIEQKDIEISNKRSELEIVSKMFVHSQHLNQIIEIDLLINQMVNSAYEFFNAYYVVLYHCKNNRFMILREYGKDDQYVAPSELSIEHTEPVIDDKMLRIPLHYENSPWGLLAVYGKRRKIGGEELLHYVPFKDEDYEILTLYTDQVMNKMKHARLLKKMQAMATIDALTGIPNRGYGESRCSKYIKRASKHGKLAIMIMDIDHFKRINDSLGHPEGDKAIRMVAQTINDDGLRPSDLLARWGGEEFLVVLDEVTQDHALMVAERIRKQVEMLNFGMPLTISVGISYYGVNGITSEELINAADKALYEAKEEGRNRVKMAD